ncbi:uncharacterized protein LOC142345478 [Convolutriloba macropyga]|uniref:uncharacterized protein LOC142345478 n=1 Tax=Convolutriloba macropyga TaxID=536237 RepID=UPI003F5212D7
MASDQGIPSNLLQLSKSADTVVGSLHVASMAINVFSVVFFPRMSRVTTSEVIILMGTLVFITLVGNLLVVCNMFHLVQGTDTNNFITMSCYHVPIIYNLFLPAILAKGASQLGSRSKASLCFCDVSYTLLSLGCLVHVVMLLSPMKAFDYHRFESRTVVSAAESSGVDGSGGSSSPSVSGPQLMLIGTLPQTISVILSIKILREVNKLRKKFTKETKAKNAASSTQTVVYDRDQIGLRNRYFSNYLRKWAILSILLVLPSSVISQFSFLSQYTNRDFPQSLIYARNIADSLIFFTQPLCVMISWLVIDRKAISETEDNDSSRLNPQILTRSVSSPHVVSSYLQQNGGVVQISMSPSPTGSLPELPPTSLPIQSQV